MSDNGYVPIRAGISAVLVSTSQRATGSRATELTQYDTVSEALAAGVALMTGDVDAGAVIRAAIDVEETDRGARSVGDVSARLLAMLGAASDGQLLVSALAVQLISKMPKGVDVADLGVVRLSGDVTSVHVFEVRGSGLTSAQIPSAAVAKTNLSLQSSPLVGRNGVRHEIGELIRSSRLVTLTGAGGAGKTRLALAVGWDATLEHGDSFTNVDWLDLAPLADSSSLLAELASGIGLRQLRRESQRQAVITELGRCRRLLVLDNAEHLIDDVARLVAELLDRCADLHVLVTSREALGLGAEVVRRVAPLDLPVDHSAGSVVASGAGQLLLQRLAMAGMETTPTDEDMALVGRVCARLDGMPLALELAAARSTTMPLSDLADALDVTFSLLSATRRDAQPRQRTMEASIRWSYDLLDPDEKLALGRLATFSDSFQLSDAVEVCGEGIASPEDVVSRLIDRSLINPGNDARLRLLETVRSFAEERLVESDEAIATRDRHLEWILARAASVSVAYDGPEPANAARDSRRLINDARSAMRHSESSGQPNAMWKLITLFVQHFFYNGSLDEAREWFERTVEVSERDPQKVDPALSAPGLVAAALLATSRGDDVEIKDALQRATLAARQADDCLSLGRATLLSGAHESWHVPGPGLEVVREGTQLCVNAGDLLWAAWGDCGAALAQTFLGRPVEALESLAGAERSARVLRSHRLLLDVLARRCICEYLVGRWGDATETIAAGRELASGFTTISVTACFDVVEGWLALDAQDAVRAERAMDCVMERFIAEGELQFVPLFGVCRARAVVMAGRPAEAVESLEQLRAYEGVGWTSIYRHWIDHELSYALFVQGSVEQARVVAQRLIDDATSIGNDLDAGRANILMARLDMHDNEVRRAEGHAHQALAVLVELGAIPAALDALEVLSSLELTLGHNDRATALNSGVELAREQMIAGRRCDLAPLVELARRARGERGRPTLGWDALTPTEMTVVELVAQGLTNPEIAERLVVGRATVKTHVSSALRKLDLAGRTQLAVAYKQRQSAGQAVS